MKVLIVVNNLRVANGVATVIMNQYDALIHNDFEVDFIQFLEFESPHVDRINSNGGKITTVSKNFKGIKKMFGLLKKGKYDILHINQMNLQTVILIIIARILGIKCVIYHSHNTKIPGGIKRNILEKMSNFVYNIFANKYIACSSRAGKDSFGKKKFVVLKNSIDVKKFQYNYMIRKKLRKEIGIDDNIFVIGTVCRFSKQKNPLLMLDIVAEVIKIRPNTVFLWVGSASSDNDPILKEMKEKVKILNIEKNMLWIGSKADVYNWYSAMDVFLMPSKWEGLGITYLEAQANSLPTFASDVVPVDTKITELIEYFPIDMSAADWAKEICKHSIRNEYCAMDIYDNFVRNGYDNLSAREDLLKIYRSFLN